MRRLIVVACLWLATCAAKAADHIPDEAQRQRSTLIRMARAEWGLDAPVAAFAAQLQQESGWQADAVSRVGARGMAQFMPSTARWVSHPKY